MPQENLLITRDSELFKTLDCLAEKFVVDFANGIDVTRDHLRFQETNSGSMMKRLIDGLTGQSARRQIEINGRLVDAVEGALQWLIDLSGSIAQSNHAIVQTRQRVAMLQKSIITIADHCADTRNQVEVLSYELNRRCDQIANEIARVDLVQRGSIHLDQVFARWEAGRWRNYSMAGRCYVALEELRWGNFGDLLRNGSYDDCAKQLEILTNRLIIQMSKDAQCHGSARLDTRQWLKQPLETAVDHQQALQYIGDWSNENRHPFVHSVLFEPQELPLLVPRLCSAERLSQALIPEVFDEK